MYFEFSSRYFSGLVHISLLLSALLAMVSSKFKILKQAYSKLLTITRKTRYFSWDGVPLILPQPYEHTKSVEYLLNTERIKRTILHL